MEQLRKDGVLFITATHDVNNPRSGAVMRAIGMKYCYSYEEQWQPKDFPECVSSGTIRKFEQILCQFKEEIRMLSSAKSSFVTQKWLSATRNCGLRNFETRSSNVPHVSDEF